MRKPFGAAESAAKFGILEEMAKVLDIEIEALQCVRQQLSSEFEEAVKTFAACTGQIIVTGVGKSGIIATKIAATLRSTGTAATFLHAGEALHGDIGMVGPTDVVLAVGKSGETSELNILLRFLKKSGARIVSLTSNESSSMAKLSDIVLNLHVPREACPLNLTPTASTTASLAIGDAIAVALMKLKNISESDFARRHPGGQLGRRLLLTVDDVMTPRARIEALDIGQEMDAIHRQLTTTYHNKLPVYEEDITRVAGILHIRKLLPLLAAGELTRELIREVLVAPYFIPTGTQLLQQLQLFQDNQQRQGLVVDEYGEVLGLVTLEDIVEEIVGEFTTQAPGAGERGLRWSDEGEVVVDGAATLRDLNRRLALALPLTGPRTLNGLLLETLQEIPDGPCCLRFAGCVVEVVQIQDQAVRSARLIRTRGATLKST